MIHQTNISETTDNVNMNIDMSCSESSEALTLTTMDYNLKKYIVFNYWDDGKEMLMEF